ncbi:hypothetical protein ACP70R_023905 [Stipagrostis hirtigluma subsp. patula]
MENLETWIAAYSSDKGVVDDFMFPNLERLTINGCHKLRVSPRPPRVKCCWEIKDSDDVLLHWGENVSHTCSSTSSALLLRLEVKFSMAPMHQWKLLHHLPALDELFITGCDDLICSSEMAGVLCSLRVLGLCSCHSMKSLPEWVGDLTSLQTLHIYHCSGIQALSDRLGDLASLQSLYISCCPGIVSLPDSIQRLTNLQELSIGRCPALSSWCELEENMTKIGHIKTVLCVMDLQPIWAQRGRPPPPSSRARLGRPRRRLSLGQRARHPRAPPPPLSSSSTAPRRRPLCRRPRHHIAAPVTLLSHVAGSSVPPARAFPQPSGDLSRLQSSPCSFV